MNRSLFFELFSAIEAFLSTDEDSLDYRQEITLSIGSELHCDLISPPMTMAGFTRRTPSFSSRRLSSEEHGLWLSLELARLTSYLISVAAGVTSFLDKEKRRISQKPNQIKQILGNIPPL